MVIRTTELISASLCLYASPSLKIQISTFPGKKVWGVFYIPLYIDQGLQISINLVDYIQHYILILLRVHV